MPDFEVEAVCGPAARAGMLALPSGVKVRTPLFMPVATKMSVKTLSPEELVGTGTEAVITNGFLSHLEPGTEVIRAAGGMHRYMGYAGGIFSDSGGFQFIRKGFDAAVSDHGVRLRSPFDGRPVDLTPEDVVEFHMAHGVDVGMVLDHCPSFTSSREEVLASARRTVDWAARSKERASDDDIGTKCPRGPDRPPMIFAITQGGVFDDIRKLCTSRLIDMGFQGYGIGGLSIGEPKEDTFKALVASTSLLPTDRPRYFMGVGEPSDIVRAVLAGVDIFDSVFPTRNARHRAVFTSKGRENIRNSTWKPMNGPIMEGCRCFTCRNFTRSYVAHLFKAEEALGPRLATIHNLHYMQQLVRGIRTLIVEDSLSGRTTLNEALEAVHGMLPTSRA